MGASVGRRVVVTGLGVLNGPCVGADELWRACIAPDPAPTHRAIIDFEPRRWLDRRAAQRTDHFAQIAVAAAQLAFEDAGRPDDEPERVGVVLGGDKGGVRSFADAIERYLEGGADAVPTLTALVTISNAAAAAVALHLGALGTTQAVSSGCAAGTHAITDGFRLVRDGYLDVVYTGGSDASAGDDLAGELMTAALTNLRVHTDDAVSRPFDADRNGFVHASAAAILRLETLDSARRRGAPVYAEVLGGGNTVDGHEMIHPDPDGSGLVRAMRAALTEAGIEPSDIGLVNCHGSATKVNDLVEVRATREVFGSPGPALTSTKAVTGHAAAAAGAVEGLLTVLAISRGSIPQTQWTRRIDPEFAGADIVVGSEPRVWKPGYAMSNSLGLGGQNGSVVFGPVNSP